MGEWYETKLDNIAMLSKTNWKVGNEPMPYLGLEHIDEGKLRLNSIGDSSEVTSNKYRFDQDSFLFGKLRPYFRKLYRPNFKGICSTDIWVVKPKDGIDKNFLFYLFANQEFVDAAYNGSSGTRMPRADWNFMKDTLWPLPKEADEQEAIAETLSSLDDKIDLLHRQNQTLEAIVETLFRQTFINNAQDNWEEKSVKFFGDIICGKTPSKKVDEYYGGEIPFIKIPDMHGNTFVSQTSDKLSNAGLQSQHKKTLPPFSICVSCIATVGLVCMNMEVCQTNQQINSIIPAEKHYRHFLYLTMRNSYDLLNAMASGGTATLNLNTSDFSRIPLLYPGEDTLEQFDKTVSPYFDKIMHNHMQITALENLRDILLPKLMSGYVRVQYDETSTQTEAA
jgi:type I restriction enzyme S subunit